MNRIAEKLFVVVLVIFAAVAVQAQTTDCSSCPGNFPTVSFNVYYPNGTSLNILVPVSSSVGGIDTVRQIMVNAACPSSGFTYTTGAYCPYGGYIQTINGVSPTGFWELYVNGTSAPCGLDTCLISPGDSVSWCDSAASCQNAAAAFVKTGKAKAKYRGESHQAKIYKAQQAKKGGS